jgi:transcriptional regulator, XRE family|nr:MAG TPA: Helix-turn-helix XRE-family like protein [Caudoviricetes sp.]
MYVIYTLRHTIFGDEMEIKILLKHIRKERNMTLKRLSEITGISEAHLSYVERGEREPSLSTIIRIAVALNIDEKELYEVKK